MPSGAVRNTRIRREKLCSWIISSVSITMTINGNRMKIEALPLADSSNAPPGLDPVGRLEIVAGCPSASAQIWLVTSGACTPSTTSERTVIAMSRLTPPHDRLLMGILDLGDLLERHGDAVAST